MHKVSRADSLDYKYLTQSSTESVRPRVVLVLAACALWVAGCAGIGIRGGVGADDLKNVKKIAVFTNMGTALAYTKYDTFEVPKWRINAFAQDLVVKQLKTKYPVGILNKVPVPGKKLDKDGVHSLQEEAKIEGYDTLVILSPAAYANTPGLRAGYGIGRANRWASSMWIYNLAIVSVYDTAKPAALGWQWSFDSISGKPNVMSAETLPWKNDPPAFTPDELTQIEGILKRHLEAQITYSLKANNLL